MAKRKNNLIRKIQNVNLHADEIENIVDSASITDEVIDFIFKKYEKQINEDNAFQHIRDIVNVVDLTKYDEDNVASTMSEAAKRSFFSLMSSGQISRPEIIYFIKNKFANDKDVECVFSNNAASQDLVDILMRWRPQLFESLLKQYCEQFGITSEKINSAKSITLQLEKFNFLLE